MATYFIADLHLGHESVIEFGARPFANVDEMNEKLIVNWNDKVTDDDDVFIIGDLFFRCKVPEAIAMVRRLKGKKHLIIGNHDFKYLKTVEFRDLFVEIESLYEMDLDGERLVLCHYPIAEWNGYFRGAWHIYGHIHNAKNPAYDYMRTLERALNAGAEVVGYAPVTFEELKKCNEEYRGE